MEKLDWNIGDCTDQMLAEFAGLEPTPIDVTDVIVRAAKKHEQNVAYRSTIGGREKLRAAMRKYGRSEKGKAGQRRRQLLKEDQS
jgi:hypothetical protein